MPDEPQVVSQDALPQEDDPFGAAPARPTPLRWRSRLRRLNHFCKHTVRAFVQNRCPVRAAALAYASLLALVPMLAVVASVTAALMRTQGEETISRVVERIVAQVAPAGAAAEARPADAPTTAAQVQSAASRKELARKINGFISEIRGGALGVTGTVLLVVVAIAMLARIEDTFNDIWGVTRGRSWVTRIGQYWAALTLGPVLLVVALALSSGPQVDETRQLLRDLPFGIGGVAGWVLEVVLPFAIVTGVFTAGYMVLPNAKVPWRAAFVGGLVGAGLWQVNNALSVLYVSQAATQHKIYGGLGTVAVFMVGLYLAWMIILFGGQVAHAFQHRDRLGREEAAGQTGQREREFLSIQLMACIAERFIRGEPPMTRPQLALSLAASERLVGGLLDSLTHSRLLVEIPGAEPAFTPGRPLEAISCHDVLQSVRGNDGAFMSAETQTIGRVQAEFERIVEAERSASAKVTLAILARAAGKH
jgi:membrane protein